MLFAFPLLASAAFVPIPHIAPPAASSWGVSERRVAERGLLLQLEAPEEVEEDEVDDTPEAAPAARMPAVGMSPCTIKVVGVGGGGGNTVNRMCSLPGSDLIEYVALNTDVQALAASRAGSTIQLTGVDSDARGLGAGGSPAVGREAASECAPLERAPP